MLNNREIAIVVWFGVLAVFVLSTRAFRSSVGKFRTVLYPKVLVLLALITIYLGGWTYVAARAGLWNTTFTKTTTIWYVGSALSFIADAHNIHRGGRLRKRLVEIVGVTVFVEYVIMSYAFSLWLELILQPVIFVLALLVGFVPVEPRLRGAARLSQWLLSCVAMVLAVHSVREFVVNWSQLDKRNAFLEFLLPIWLTLVLVPAVLLLSVWSNYEGAYGRIDRFGSTRGSRLRAKVIMSLRLNVRLRTLADFAGFWNSEIAQAGSWSEAWRVVSRFEDQRTARLEEERRALARLEDFAGVDGVDEEGARLDQREFKETRSALETLAAAQMGWYRRENRYRHEPLDLLESTFTLSGLPSPSGIQQGIRQDGQAWFAWRRTVTGWCLGIGANGAPPDQWFFDGPDPPKGFPRPGPGWSKAPQMPGPNWS